ncbi:hypothetical protein KY290_031401 [Solanum tuberosum]|uniref:Reverse transcriptase zinc-binding domain-containing protein n=1 Tax=Solanum tuberosum TaxID=4113 RepID=A0ABQ7UA90_SOLTU|nr:hypothetical protein KY289_032117 [Solanum tuberosum]KAH0743408.1 hypothetical protein KY290_031401 [Solanum tuberosum]
MVSPSNAAWVVKKIIDSRQSLMTQHFFQGSIHQTLARMVQGDKFKIQKAYVAMQPQLPKVSWKNITLHKSVHPRFKFIMWLAIQQRLATVERLQKIGIQVPMCVYSNQIWTRMLKWMGNYRSIGPWQQEIEWVSRIAKKKIAQAEAICCTFAMVIYNIWKDRNTLRFKRGQVEVSHTCKDIAMHLHIQGRNKASWQTMLSSLNHFP